MIRSCRIPSVLKRICTDDIIQTAMLVTTDGELLGSTSKFFICADGTSKLSIESLGSLIADIAVDYNRLGEEYANLDVCNEYSSGTAAITPATTTTSSGGRVEQQQQEQQLQQSNTINNKKSSHLQCLLLELELGLVAVSTCVVVDCMVIAISSPLAPLGSVKARLNAITEYVQEALNPLTVTDRTASTVLI